MSGSNSGPWTPGRIFVLGILGIAVVVLLSLLWLGKYAVDKSSEAARAVAETPERIIEKFRPGVVVESFAEWKGLEAEGNEGNVLEVANATATETLREKTSLRVKEAEVPGGAVTVEVEVPATYRYHIDLDGDWAFEQHGSRLVALAPALRPSLPVAFDTRGMRKKTETGWIRWILRDGDRSMDKLEKSITARLEERARDGKTVERAREEARTSVAKFLKRWLVDQSAWAEGRFESIAVVFADEEGVVPSSQLPSLVWSREEGGSAEGELDPAVE